MEDLLSIARHFDLGDDELATLKPLGIGHINDTFLGEASAPDGAIARYVFQRINRNVFPDIDALMENIERVVAHLGGGLRLVRTKARESFHRDAHGACWRAFPFIEGTVAVDGVGSRMEAEQAGRAFGQFSSALSDLPGPRLHETIPDFHNTPKRFADFLAAVEADPANRAAGARAEIETAIAGAHWAGVIADAQASGAIPERIAHNDAKIENVLFDAETGEAVCVVDLDTVMPGTVLHDFGDLVRSAAATAAEDECDLGRVGVSMPVFEAVAAGFLHGCGGMLVPAEIALLPVAGTLISYEQSLRFLTDYLLSDPYYKTRSEEHNLERTRNQLRMVDLLVTYEEEMSEVIASSC